MSTPWSLLSYYYSGNDRKNIAEMFAVCNQGVYGFMGIIILLRGCFHLERVCNAGILRIVFYCCLIHFSSWPRDNPRETQGSRAHRTMGQRWLLLPGRIITNNSSQGLASLIRGNYVLISVTFLLDLSMGSFVGPAIFLFYILKSKSIHYGEYKICMSFVGIFGYLKNTLLYSISNI